MYIFFLFLEFFLLFMYILFSVLFCTVSFFCLCMSGLFVFSFIGASDKVCDEPLRSVRGKRYSVSVAEAVLNSAASVDRK